MNLVDLVIVLAALAYALGGFRSGAIVGLSSLAGFFGGAVLGAQVARPLGSAARQRAGRRCPSRSSCVLVVALVGQVLGVVVGGSLRRRVTWRAGQARRLARSARCSAWCRCCWWPGWSPCRWRPRRTRRWPSAVRRSAIVGARQRRGARRRAAGVLLAAPVPRPQRLPAGVRRPAVDPGRRRAGRRTRRCSRRRSCARRRSRRSRSTPTAPGCERAIEGSAFVYAPGRLLTNAHVVAGASDVVGADRPTAS